MCEQAPYIITFFCKLSLKALGSNNLTLVLKAHLNIYFIDGQFSTIIDDWSVWVEILPIKVRDCNPPFHPPSSILHRVSSTCFRKMSMQVFNPSNKSTKTKSTGSFLPLTLTFNFTSIFSK